MLDYRKIGHNIYGIRVSKNLTQQDFSKILCDYMKKPTLYSPSVVSSWETGRRKPSDETLHAISDLFKVSYDELCGEDRQAAGRIIYDRKISPQHYGYYIGKPVWVVYDGNARISHFGILVYHSDSFYIRSIHPETKVSTEMSIYANKFDYLTCENHASFMPLGLTSIMKRGKNDLVYLSMITDDLEVRTYYNGWYRLSSNKKFLEADDGRVFSINGLNKAFHVYNDSID